MLTVLSYVLACGLVVTLGFSAYLWNISRRLPDLRVDPSAIEVAETSVVYAADGSVIAKWYEDQDRTVVPAGKIPPALKAAVVAIEDQRFYQHSGVDPQAIVRALSVNAASGGVRQGGSTITQQTVKLLFTDGKRTLGRKVEEALLALQLEAYADKDEVLAVYLNTVYFGHGAYGVESAANRFFGKTSESLTLPECALLAGCIQSPTRYDPFSNPAAAQERRNTVLVAMREQGRIGVNEASASIAEPLALNQKPERTTVAPYFVEYVRRDLLHRLGSRALYRGGLHIYTTLDPLAQKAAEDAAKRVLPKQSDPEVALASVRWRDGSVVALVGGRDFGAEQFDLATQGRRQTGSAFKPFVLAAALEEGIDVNSRWSGAPYSTPVRDGTWNVENYENAVTGGTFTLSTATVWSINTVYARLIVAVGPEKVVDVAHRMGITTPIAPEPAIALGGLDRGVSPLEMASAFGTIANKGVAVAPSGILRVVDAKGKTIYEPNRGGRTAISKRVAAELDQVLGEVYERGTGMSAKFGRPAAVKTGTSQSWRDAWIVGYSGNLSTAVWVGYPDSQVAMDHVRGKKVTGGSFPADVWREYMRAASRRPLPAVRSSAEGTVAAGYSIYVVCDESHMLARPDCPDTTSLVIRTGEYANEYCTLKH